MKNKIIKIADLKKINIFKVPKNYFEELPVRLEIELSLLNLNKENAFKTPENYFENLADRIQNKISEQNFEHEKTKIYLEKLEKVNVFKVKEHYFEDLAEKIEKDSRLKTQDTRPFFKISWSVQRTFAAAASVIFLVGISWFFMAKPPKENPELALKNISNQEIINYLQDQDLSNLEFAVNTKFNKISSPNASDSLTIKHLNLKKEDILKHLENENVEEI